jgi:hypothetical protein
MQELTTRNFHDDSEQSFAAARHPEWNKATALLGFPDKAYP